jgi:hypothetical protein
MTMVLRCCNVVDVAMLMLQCRCCDDVNVAMSMLRSQCCGINAVMSWMPPPPRQRRDVDVAMSM